jgi:Phage P22-like portal protein
MADSIVEIATKRFEKAKAFYSPLRQLAIEDTKFVMGDSDNNWQWPELAIASRINKPCLTINITAQHCNQIINNIRQNRPAAKILPRDGDADIKTAEILGGMLRAIQSYSNADTAHDIAAEHAVYGGEGFWRVLTEYESDESFNQTVIIKPLVNPQLVYIDHNAIEPDRSDAKWGFIFEDISHEQAKLDYPDIDASSWGSTSDASGWVGKDTIRLAEYFWCEDVKDTLLALDDGAIIAQSKLHDGAKVEGEFVIAIDGSKHAIKNKREITTKKWWWCKLLGGQTEPIDKKEWVGSYLPIITVVGKEVNINGEIVRKGIVRDIKDSARMVNYSYSSAVESNALQNKAPYLASKEAIEGFENEWAAANVDAAAYLPYNALTETGDTIPMPERVAPASIATAQVQMLQMSTEQMRASSGQSNSNFGIKSEASSGIGIQRLKAQGEIATFHFPDNLARALKYEATVIVDLIKKIYDTKQIVMILGLDGKNKSAMLDPEMQQAHQETSHPEVESIFNPLVGRYDIAIDTGPSYQTQRQESAEALTQLAKGDPQLMQIAGDIIMRSYDFPLAEEMAKRLEKALPPNLKDEPKGQPQVPPELQQHMQKQDEMIKQMGTALENAHTEVTKLEEEKEFKLLDLQIKAQDSDTKRLQVVGAGLSTEQIQALVAESVQAALVNNPSQAIAEDMQEGEQDEQEDSQEGGDDGQPQPPPQPTASDHLAALAGMHGELLQGIHGLTQQLSKPKQVIRDENGKIIGTQ